MGIAVKRLYRDDLDNDQDAEVARKSFQRQHEEETLRWTSSELNQIVGLYTIAQLRLYTIKTNNSVWKNEHILNESTGISPEQT